MKQLRVRNQQHARPINGALVRSLTRHLLEERLNLTGYELSIHFISARRMAEINRQYLQHPGSTDVITFDYREGYEGIQEREAELSGEIFISVEDATRQACEFKTTWQEEIARYVIHGVLHLLGYDDLASGDRREMKREENRLLREISTGFDLRKVAR